MRLTLHIDTDNAAFGNSDTERNAEIARILHKLADDLRRSNDPFRPLRDINGNRVGIMWLATPGDQ